MTAKLAPCLSWPFMAPSLVYFFLHMKWGNTGSYYLLQGPRQDTIRGLACILTWGPHIIVCEDSALSKLL